MGGATTSEAEPAPPTRGALGELRHILTLSAPLMVSYGSIILYEFIDLIYLSRYSSAAFAAIFPAFVVHWNILVLFVASAAYLRVFMGAEIGVGRRDGVGRWLWLGFAVAVAATVAFAGLYLCSDWIFATIGHDPVLQRLEVAYFDVMVLSVFFLVAKVSFEAYYIAVARPMVILAINALSIAANIVFSGLLIFGVGGLPEMGIAGAAMGTVIAAVIAFAGHVVYAACDADARRHRVLRRPVCAARDVVRLLRTGVPHAVEHVFEELVWTVLILVIGTLGVVALSLSNVAISLMEFVFLPIIAVGEVLSVELAKRLHAGAPDPRAALVRPVLAAVLAYVVVGVLLLFGLSDAIVALFFAGLEIPDRDATLALYFAVLAGCLAAGSFYYINNAVLAGLGDTVFPMAAMALGFVTLFLLPTVMLIVVHELSFLWGWAFFTATLAVLAAVNAVRYLATPRPT